LERLVNSSGISGEMELVGWMMDGWVDGWVFEQIDDGWKDG
jgi:hypothetical protein